jgi:hypothetical protein
LSLPFPINILDAFLIPLMSQLSRTETFGEDYKLWSHSLHYFLSTGHEILTRFLK